MSGLDVAGLVDRQHDEFQQAVYSVSNQLELKPKRKLLTANSKLSSEKSEPNHREKEARAEAYQREQAAKADACQREKEVRAMAKAEALQREKQVRSEVEKELEIDRLRRQLAKKEAKERQPQLSSASHLVGAPTSTGVGPTDEVLVAVLNR